MVVTDPILFMLKFWGNATRFLLYGTGVRDIRHNVFSDGKFLLQRTPPELKSLSTIQYSEQVLKAKDTFYLFGVIDLQLRPEGTSLSPTRRP